MGAIGQGRARGSGVFVREPSRWSGTRASFGFLLLYWGGAAAAGIGGWAGVNDRPRLEMLSVVTRAYKEHIGRASLRWRS